MAKSKEQKQKNPASDINPLWLLSVVCVLGALFFSFSVWIRTPDEKVVHVVNHKTKKVLVDKAANQRQVKGYNVAY